MSDNTKTWGTLQLSIEETTYKTKPAKVKLYRQIMAFEDAKAGMNRGERDGRMIELLGEIYGITPDQAEEMDAADLLPAYHDAVACLIKTMVERLDKLPNDQTPDAVAAE